MESGEASLPLERARLGDGLDAETARVAGENGVRRGQVVESSEEGLLDGEILDDGFDDEIGMRNGGGGVGGGGNVRKSRFDERGLFGGRRGMELLGDAGDGFVDDGATVVERGVRNVGHNFFGRRHELSATLRG